MLYRKQTKHQKQYDLQRRGKVQKGTVLFCALFILNVFGIVSICSGSLSGKIRLGIFEGRQEINVWMEEDDIWIFLPSGCGETVWELPERFGHSWSINGGKLISGSPLLIEEGESAQLVEKAVFGLKSWEYTIHVLKSEKIPSLYLETGSKSMEYIHETKENSEEGTIKTADASGEGVYEGKVAKIKGRGNYTWLLDKKSYTLTFSEPVGLFGMQKREQWVLQACADEDTHMLNRMVFEMMRAAGIENVQESCWVDVFLNGEYAGNYLLSQKVGLPEDGEHGDWMAEFDGYWADEGGVGFVTGEGQQVAVIKPENASDQKVEEIAGIFEKVEQELNTEGTGDWKAVLDAPSIVKKYVLDEISKCPDGFNGSNYCYLKNGKLYFGAPWDYGFSFGNQLKGVTGLALPDGLHHQLETLWYRRLWRNEEFQEAVAEEYQSFFRPYLKKAAEEQLDRWAGEIRNSMKMDAVRWGRHEKNFESELQNVKGFIADRLSWLDREWLGTGSGEVGVYHTLTLMDGDEADQVYYIRDGSYVKRDMLDRDDEHFRGWFMDKGCTVAENIQGKPVHEDIVLYANISQRAARLELIMGMVPLGTLLAVLAVWMLYSIKKRNR